ncbi:ATP-binding cassette domain-containing protein [Micromonospora sp. CPCC 205371]|nr:ATP-binding cassette domain-containing protein [Micromonospora sp. CPCC 205371]
MTAAVRVHGLRYAFNGSVAVSNIDLTVQTGEVFGLLGPNGAGKTTTIRAITALLPVPAGTISIFGLDVTRNRMAVRRLIGYVPQMLSADSDLTGRENVSLFARLFDVPRRQRAARVDEVIDAMGLTEAADRRASTYSGGMVRRLELAQALISMPRLLILDEPTIGLDPLARSGVWERIAAIRRDTGMTVLVTTHYMDEAEQACDRVALMHRGEIRVLGAPEALIADLPEPDGDLDDVFRAHVGDHLDDDRTRGMRDVRASRRTARRLG